MYEEDETMYNKGWNKVQYINWIKTRGPIGEWDMADCRAADEHIRRRTLIKFRRHCRIHISSKPVRDLMILFVECHYGTIEVDTMLSKLKMYPKYMEE